MMLREKQIGDMMVVVLSDRWASSWRLDFGAMDVALKLLNNGHDVETHVQWLLRCL
jgi:hypothetical protein